MKLSVVLISIALTIPAVFAQKYPKQRVYLNSGARPAFSTGTRSVSPRMRLAPKAAAPAAAPLVVQTFLDPATGVLTAYAIVTGTIPAGTQVTGGMTLLDDMSTINFQQVPVQNDLGPGDYFQLPVISSFGDLWNPGAFDYTVQVIPSRGAMLSADGVFLVNETLAFADLPNFLPIIASATQGINSGKDVILALKGYFNTDPAQVVLSDLASFYVVSPSAVTVSATEIDIDMSQVNGFDLASLNNLLVTVSQDNVGDTVAFRYVPPQPGTYNPAPTQ